MAVPSSGEPIVARRNRSERFLATLSTASDVVLVSHVNPDPDALASMLGLQALIASKMPEKAVTMTVDGIIARAENQAMVDLLQIPLVPVGAAPIGPETAVVMVDSQPYTGRRASEDACPIAVLDHHETPGSLDGVRFKDIRPNLGATCTMVTGYLLEQGLAVTPRLATALLYGIESETTGYPREASPSDDGALVWLSPGPTRTCSPAFATRDCPRATSPRSTRARQCVPLPRRRRLLVRRGPPARHHRRVGDFFIRFDQVGWALSVGLFDGMIKLSLRSDHIGGHCGEVLRDVVDGLGHAGGHDRRAGGAIPLKGPIDDQLRDLRRRFLDRLDIEGPNGHRLLEACPIIPTP